MSKISELKYVLGTGARNNKYRVYIPMFDELGGGLDILVQTASLPGKSLTPTEMIIKGRKTYLRGDMAFDGSWEMSFFNTEDMKERAYFIAWMNAICNTDMQPTGILGGIGIGGINLNSIQRAIKGIKDLASNIASNPLSLISGIQPTYQKDIKIEQLNYNEENTMAVRLIGAFPTSVSAVELSDTQGEVSTTTVTFAYTDVEVEDNASIIKGDIFGDG